MMMSECGLLCKDAFYSDVVPWFCKLKLKKKKYYFADNCVRLVHVVAHEAVPRLSNDSLALLSDHFSS